MSKLLYQVIMLVVSVVVTYLLACFIAGGWLDLFSLTPMGRYFFCLFCLMTRVVLGLFLIDYEVDRGW